VSANKPQSGLRDFPFGWAFVYDLEAAYSGTVAYLKSPHDQLARLVSRSALGCRFRVKIVSFAKSLPLPGANADVVACDCDF
jgi:hypothetical protein